MKHVLPVLTFSVILLVSSSSIAFGEMKLNNAILIPFEDSDIVLVGKVIQTNSTKSINKTEYAIAVEEYLKNPKPYDMITAVGEGIKKEIKDYNEVNYYNEPIFEEGERAFLYLNEKDGKYVISPYSFGITKNLPMGGPPDYVRFNFYKNKYYTNEQITVSGIIEKGYLYSSAAELGTNSTVSIVVYNPNHEKYLYDDLDIKPNGSFRYELRIKGDLGITGDYEYDLLIGTTLTGSTFEYVANPLKQFKSGIAATEVKCKEDLQIIIKSHNEMPACVKPTSIAKLVAWGWAKSV